MKFKIDNEKNFARIKYYSDKLEFLWEKYLRVLDIIIYLSGGTLFLFFSTYQLSDTSGVNGVNFALIGVSASAFALLSSLIWRFVSQHFMEVEILGPPGDVDDYFELCGIDPVTATYGKQKKMRKVYRFVYKTIPTLTSLSLLAAWGLILVFVIMNA